jgi:C_GCAxxG_C_C family probable redox protein
MNSSDPTPATSDLNRREMLKLSMVAGVTLAAGALPQIAGAVAEKNKAPADRPEAAKNHFLKSMNCSQAILETYGPALGLQAEVAKRLATGFAGGMGMGTECGAVTAALMVLGLKFGPAEKDTFPQVAKFIDEFKARHGRIGCSELLGTDMGTPEGVKAAADKGYFTSRCPGYVRSAGEILDKILA